MKAFQASPAVVIRQLSEEFRILEDKAFGLKEVVSRFRLAKARTRFLALRDVSLQINSGETVGMIGRNGSGKSTLLKCIAGILPPSKGEVLVGGTVASLIELGAGFHGELTGRENAMVVGTLFGMTRRQILQRFEEIVSFAELDRVIDHPYRTYSSGMQVRLAFALAIHVEPHILLIDEVLAVGDEAFQRKCVNRVAKLREQGVTIVFVSHDLSLVREVCNRCIWLNEGQIFRDGPTAEVIDKYLASERFSEDEIRSGS